MKKTIILLALLFLMAGVLGGCQKDEVQQEQTTKAPVATEAAGDSKTSTEAPAEPEEPKTIKLFLPFSVEFEEDNPVIVDLQQATNTVIEFELPPSNNYTERLQLLLSSGELPDMFRLKTGATMNELHRSAAEDGMVIDLTDYLPNFPNIQEYINPMSWASMDILQDGGIYAVPRPTLNRQDGFLIRKDWMDNLGLTMPEDGIMTLDYFAEVLEAFTYGDPDGNGVDDTYGLSLNAEGGMMQPNSAILSSFGEQGWQKAQNGGDYEYITQMYDKNSTVYAEALAYHAMMWEKEIVDPSWPSNQDNSTYIDRFMQGLCGVVFASAGQSVTREQTMKELTPNVELSYIIRLAKKEGDTPIGRGFGNGSWGAYAVTGYAKENDNVDVVLSILDYMLSDEGWSVLKYGIEGVHYNVENGQKVFTPAYDEFYSVLKEMALVRRYNDIEYMSGPATTDPEVMAKFVKWTGGSASNLVLSLDDGYSPAAVGSQEYIDYQTIMAENVAKIITGELPVDSWNDVLDEWYENGGEELVVEMNNYIKSRQQN